MINKTTIEEEKKPLELSTRVRNLLLPNKVIKGKMATASGVDYWTIQRWLHRNDAKLTQAGILQVIREETGLTDELILES